MSKPLQFSLRQLFILVTSFCLLAWFFSTARNPDSKTEFVTAALFVVYTSFGGVVGALSSKPVVGGMCGAAVAAVFSVVISLI